MCFPQNASAGKSKTLLPFLWVQAGGDNPAVCIQAGSREAGQSRGSSKGQLTMTIQTTFCLAPFRSHREMGEQDFACCGLARTAKVCGAKKKPAALLIPLQLLKDHLPSLCVCIDSTSNIIILYRKHHGLEKFILTAICQNISLLH